MLEDSPAALIAGARQCGKTTLARDIGAELGYQYFTFDEDLWAVPAGMLWG